MSSRHGLRDQLDGLSNKVQHIDSVYPEAFSRHGQSVGGFSNENAQKYKRANIKKIDRRGRYRTQPVTFTEIQEVDEENLDTPGSLALPTSELNNSEDSNLLNPSSSKSLEDVNLKEKFEEFSKSLSHRRPRNRPLCNKRKRQQQQLREKQSIDCETGEEAEESGDTLGDIGPLLPHIIVGMHHGDASNYRNIDYPPGFSFKPRPSV